MQGEKWQQLDSGGEGFEDAKQPKKIKVQQQNSQDYTYYTETDKMNILKPISFNTLEFRL